MDYSSQAMKKSISGQKQKNKVSLIFKISNYGRSTLCYRIQNSLKYNLQRKYLYKGL